MAPRANARSPSYILPSVVALSLLSLVVVVYKVDDFATQTKTLAGHNLDPTPWHLFPPKTFSDEALHDRAYKLIHCSYLACRYRNNDIPERRRPPSSSAKAPKCPNFFRWIHHDLEPWARTRISAAHLEAAKQYAAFRVVIVGGKLYVDLYWACVQSRAMFTIWGLLQLLARYPDRVPDVDIMFDCMDKPIINRTEHESMPLPLFRYCTDEDHFDIPFPDWSFWGWPELHIYPWNEQFRYIKRGSKERSWRKKEPFAYWKGNPDVSSPVRTELLNCNDTKMWRAQIMRQDWEAEARAGYEQSKLSNQCNHRYKIYAEGYAWSVSLKYIVSCGSLTLIITPQYEDFFSRGLIPRVNYWPISPNAICPSIKSAVDWAHGHQSEAKEIGQRGQDFMESLSMDRVYDYMFHLITEYSKRLDFKPVPPDSALEVCAESLICLADPKQKHFFEKTTAYPSASPPCTLQSADSNLIKRWRRKKKEIMEAVEDMNPKEGRRLN
ncbi:O-glucosyltransferase rumi [Prunus yedoensis var. nudiflora]|uniref:O-glucosyltransferase rumi n=1 Tax=Prunus yedoensis var. nudiflora TaxID=2094558 RepID=A0A314Z3H3_PRUYE|nr:O-glucosyltransferase rumi [Prunus yedoensis var. nudiflora]